MTEELNLKHEVSHYEELLHQDAYAPEEVAELLHIPERWVLKAAFGGELKAEIINGDVIEVTRHDLVEWIKRRKNS